VAHFANSFTNQTSMVEEIFEHTRHTWTVGGGFEYALTNNIVARLEYRYTPFPATRYYSVTAFPGFGISADQEPALNEIRTGVTVKF
jgi:outer membrane immunogenic protein